MAVLALLALTALCSFREASAQTFETVLNTNLFQPASVAVSSQNHYFIADTANHRIIDFNADNSALRVLAGPERAPFESGAVDGQRIDARFRNPQGILCVGERTFVADTGNHAIREIKPDGTVITIAGDITLAHEVDDFGGLPSNWGFVDGPGATARFSAPCGLAWDGAARLYIADSGNHAIRALDLNTFEVSTVVRSGLTTPVSVAAGRQGVLYISDAGVHSIKQWRPGESRATLVAGGGTPLARGFRNSSIASNALFSAPGGIFYREIGDELIVADSGNGVLRTVQGISSAAPKVDTFANSDNAGLQTPIAVTRDLYGVFLVCDSTRNALISIITVKFPRIEKPKVGYIQVYTDTVTGLPVAKLTPVTEQTFDNMVRIAVSGDETSQHHFTFSASTSDQELPSLPGTNNTTAVNFPDPIMPAPPEDVLNNLSLNATLPPRYNFKVKVLSAPKGVDERIPSSITEAIFRFKCATPQLDSQTIPGRLLFRCNTTNAAIYYTMNGNDPIKGTPGVQFLRSGDSIPLILTTGAIQVKARAYLDDRFLPSDMAKAEFSPDNFVPNRISLGFADGEASTQMRGAPGQRYFTPVTLSLMPNAQAYGLQFDVALEPKTGPASPDYQMAFHSTLVEKFPETNRTIPPSVYVLAGTNFVTNFVTEVVTNYTYQVALTNFSPLPATNYVSLTNRLRDVVPVITTTFVTNLGQIFPISTTNYVTNTFQLVSESAITNTFTEIETDYLYQFTAPSVTNVVRVDSLLPATSPVLVTNLVANMGQLYAFTTTNYVTNAFNLVSSEIQTNASVTYDTNFTYRAVSPAFTNYVSLNGYVPDSAQVIVTNFVSNLGQQFPVVTTNLLNNSFDLISASLLTNVTIERLTNYTYQASTAGSTNFLFLDRLLPDAVPVVLTNFVTNLGQLYPIVSTNYISNAFNLVSASYNTNIFQELSTNFLYEAVTPGQTNTLVLNRVLPETSEVLTTNAIANMGELFPIVTTNRVTNAFNLVSASITSNRTIEVLGNFVYEVSTAPRTTTILLDHLLPDTAEVITTNLVQNLGRSFPVATTNIITNSFNLFSVDLFTNSIRSVSTNFEYQAVTPATTNFFTLDRLLPDSTAFVSTNFVTNMGALYPVKQTNYINNRFDLLFADVSTNTVVNVSTSFLYSAITSATTNYVTLNRILPDEGPVVTSIVATNQGQFFIMSSTNYARNVFELVSVDISTNVLNRVNFDYQYGEIPVTNMLLWPTPLPDQAQVVTTNTIVITNTLNGSIVAIPVELLNVVDNAVDFIAPVFDHGAIRYLYEFKNTIPAGSFSTTNPVALPFLAELRSTGYITNVSQTFSVEFSRLIANPVVTTNATTTVIRSVQTNALYRLRTPAITNYVTLSTNLPDVAPVVTSGTITNLGQSYSVSITNYATNVFNLVSVSYATNPVVTYATNAVYQFRTAAVTNRLSLPDRLPDFAPVVTTTFLSNLGQQFPISTTNYVANWFEFLGETRLTNDNVTVQTNVVYVFTEPATTNYVTWPDRLPDQAAVVVTNFVENLGQRFPVLQTNYLNNVFRLASSSFKTNEVTTYLTNVVYEFRTAATTNRILWPDRLPQEVPVVTTNFVSNLGQLFPVPVTNFLANSFRLVDMLISSVLQTDVETNIVYALRTPGVTNYLELDTKLPDTVTVVSTNFINNLGQLFPVKVTNTFQNTFVLLATNYITDSRETVTTNVLYGLRTPSVTNYVTWPVKLPDFVTVVSTNFITNLAQVFPVLSTNIVLNQFDLLSTNYGSNVVLSVQTNIFYEFHTPAVTNLFALSELLPDYVQVVSTNFITNLGRLFPVMTTNYVENMFDLLATNYTTNTTFDVKESYLYAVVTAGAGPEVPSSISTNVVTLDHLLPAIIPVVNLAGSITNLGEVYPIYTTNYMSNSFRLVSESYITNLYRIALTNASDAFANLVITNTSQSWLAVGWIERYGQTNLYNTKSQHLLSYSQPHNNVFQSSEGEAVVGAVSFVVPVNAVAGQTYGVRIARPSATADGVSQDMYIQAPDESDTNSPVRAVKTLTVTNHVGYIAGDVSDFRWFNAGEFGDGNILNNDLTEFQQSIVYGFNMPPEDSDFLDAMDTCCFTVDGRDLSAMQYAAGSRINIDEIAFGEGSRYAPLGTRPSARLEINDLFVAFRRALDPDLVWYQRYWSNGTRHATIVPNTFRGDGNSLKRQSTVSALALPVGPSIQSDQASALTVFADIATGLPGKVVAVPIRVRVEGGYPLRTLMFNARVETADGTVLPNSGLNITMTDPLGLPTMLLNGDPGRAGVAWLDTSVAGILGEKVVARLLFTIPADAQPTTVYHVKLDRVSGSPNGISLFPVHSADGLVAMANRPTSIWNDGIPDAWRTKYFGTVNDLNSAAGVDADRDGLSNIEEYKLGTNPLDANDSLRLKALANGHGVKLRFRTASGKVYRIEGTTTLLPGSWTIVQSNVPGTGAEMELPAPGGARAFYYRVRLQE